jgi:hypothetical protein
MIPPNWPGMRERFGKIKRDGWGGFPAWLLQTATMYLLTPSSKIERFGKIGSK